jgi:hypothetical protein
MTTMTTAMRMSMSTPYWYPHSIGPNLVASSHGPTSNRPRRTRQPFRHIPLRALASRASGPLLPSASNGCPFQVCQGSASRLVGQLA